MSISDTSSEDDRPIMATRLAEAIGWIMIGGLPTFGQDACAWVSRSWTICRAAYRSVPGLEDQVDGGQAGHRRRVDVVQPGHAVEQVLLQRHRDQLLHLGGRQAERLGLDLDRGGHQLRVHVDRSAPQLDERQDD